MKSLSSSLFGRCFGHKTRVEITPEGLTIHLKQHTRSLTWTQLSSAPLFQRGVFGQTLTFATASEGYQLSKLAYRGAMHYQSVMMQHWMAAHRARLEKLLNNIDNHVQQRYLRDGDSIKLKASIEQEYQRWFPWVMRGVALGDIKPLIQRLAHYQHWQPEHLDACRETFIQAQQQRHADFFARVESNPLSEHQQRACIIDNDNNLLLAGAGTGKTSVIVGRAGYLLHSQQARPSQLLLLAYGQQAAQEMDQRIKQKLQLDTISASTFHRLGLQIIKQVEGRAPTLSPFVDDEKAKTNWLSTQFNRLLQRDVNYGSTVIDYLCHGELAGVSGFDFEQLGDYYHYLMLNDVRSLQGEPLSELAHQQIANWLWRHGIDYQYQVRYQHGNDAQHADYRADFYLPEHALYIDFYALNAAQQTPRYIDAQQYQQTIESNAQYHRQNGTRHIVLTQADCDNDRLCLALSAQLDDLDVGYQALAQADVIVRLQQGSQLERLTTCLQRVLGLFKAANISVASLQQQFSLADNQHHLMQGLRLLQPLLKAYQAKLAESQCIDFEDMINRATHYVESGQFRSPWRYIMVDEFQDISAARARLVKALRDNHPGSSLFAVGDDWQAIYRFSGADLRLTTDFGHYFGDFTQSVLDKTYRFNDRIADLASDFVSKNPQQIAKTIRAVKKVSEPAVSVLYVPHAAANNKQIEPIAELQNGALEKILRAIAAKVTTDTSVYLLARNWSQLPDKKTLKQLNQRYPTLHIDVQSFHGAKGKEADVVVILGLTATPHGFPHTRAVPDLEAALLADEETFAFAEARRLFYVALTRAKDRVYLVADNDLSNPFVEELVKDHDLCCDEFARPRSSAITRCPTCKTGELLTKSGRYGTFDGCHYFPRCQHRQTRAMASV